MHEGKYGYRDVTVQYLSLQQLKGGDQVLPLPLCLLQLSGELLPVLGGQRWRCEVCAWLSSNMARRRLSARFSSLSTSPRAPLSISCCTKHQLSSTLVCCLIDEMKWPLHIINLARVSVALNLAHTHILLIGRLTNSPQAVNSAQGHTTCGLPSLARLMLNELPLQEDRTSGAKALGVMQQQQQQQQQEGYKEHQCYSNMRLARLLEAAYSECPERCIYSHWDLQ
ncbi:hypothetical protein E2C01_020027 [Portunus trituberculatus]|uniref:Uncharacterized protein n=1 Tax=Portunus trituberculatus TaxID=210409 RepID=A0A5B7E0M5_PORTR|nr:hypothetical protein [Portunus trituberculatus]